MRACVCACVPARVYGHYYTSATYCDHVCEKCLHVVMNGV